MDSLLDLLLLYWMLPLVTVLVVSTLGTLALGVWGFVKLTALFFEWWEIERKERKENKG